uniref:Zinc finger protein 385A n=1 Tax=Paramormyrops kingsleyae TaxID=1676925 RepID=A0A3B3SA63_9TELE
MIIGSINHAGSIPALLQTPTVIQPHVEIKPFLQIPMEAPPPSPSLRLFHNFSMSQAEAHYKGNRHARRVKGIETSKSRPQETSKTPPAPVTSPSPSGALPAAPDSPNISGEHDTQSTGQGTSKEGTPFPVRSLPLRWLSLPLPLLPCYWFMYLIKLAVLTFSCVSGTKHKTILEARSGLGPIKAYPRLGPKPISEQGGTVTDPNTQERTFHCEICNVRVNSELQLKQHISSRRHRDGVAGKPNPLLSRHKKHRVADLTTSLSFSKDLTKALGAALLPNPLALAAAMAAAASSNPLALRAAGPAHHLHHHLLQAPPLSHAVLRPAPGPIRTSHGPILFSPY